MRGPTTLVLLTLFATAALCDRPSVAVTDRNDGAVAAKPQPAADSRPAVRESDPSTNSGVRAVTSDPAGEDSDEPRNGDWPAPDVKLPASAPGTAADPGEPTASVVVAEHKDDDSLATVASAAEADAEDKENASAGKPEDHEVEPQEEGGEEGEEIRDEEEADAEEEGGEEGDEEEEEGTEEMEHGHAPHGTFAENDDEEFDDDPKTKNRGVNVKDFDWSPKKGASVTPQEMRAPKEVRGEHFDGDGNRDVKNLSGKGGNRVDELNKDIAAKLSQGGSEMDKLKALAADKAAENPDGANAGAVGGETSAANSRFASKSSRRAPRKTPAARPDLPLLRAGAARLPTARRRPTPLEFRPDTALTFDWRGAFNGHTFAKIPHSPAMESASFTVAFWLTVHAGSDTNAWRSVMHKGFTNFQRTPSLWLEYGSNRLYAAISTTYSSDETVLSKTSLTPGVPAHIAYVVRGRTLELYIDGVLEASKALRGKVVTNTGPLYLGKDPFYRGAEVDMHSFSWHARPMGEREIRITSQRTRESVVASFDRSGKFDGGSLSSLTFPHMPELSTDDFTVSFWITLRSHGSGETRAILHKGMEETERTPYIALDKQRNRLSVRVSTTSHDNEGFFSERELRLNQPTHVAYVRRAKELSLFIDGELDTQVSTRGHTKFNNGAVFVGNSPFNDGFDGEISGFRWSRRAFTNTEVLTVLRGTASPGSRIRTSSQFGARDFIRVPHIPSLMDAPDFTVSMWLRPTKGPSGKWRSIFHKGRNARERTPSLWFNPKTMQVTAEVSLGRSLKRVFRVTSRGVVPVGKTTHVALTLKDGKLCIVREGWVDNCGTIPSGSRVRANIGNLMIGKSSRFPGFAGFITDFRYHARAMPRSEISPYEMDIPEGVYAYWNPALGDHVLSLNKRVYGEGLHGYQIISSGEGVGVHGKGSGDPIGFAHNIKGKGLVPLYELFNDRTGDHTYTTSASEARPGYEPMGVTMYVFPKNHHKDPTVVPVYEHFNAKLGDSFFTTDAAPKHGYVAKGVAFYLHKAGSTAIPVREYYVPNAGGGATLEIAAPLHFSGWSTARTSDLGFVTPSKDFSISFWLRLDSDGRGFYRTIVHHGGQADQRSPAIYLMPHEPRLAVRMSTGADFNNGFDSNTVLPIGQYTHVVLSSQGNILILYINGEVDSTHTFVGHRSFDASPFFLGRYPNTPGMEGVIAGFKFFDHVTSIGDARKLMLGDTSTAEVDLVFGTDIKASSPLSVPHSSVLDSEAFTLLVEYVPRRFPAKGEPELPIAWKGNNKDESTPSLSVTADGRLMLRLSTSATAGKPDAYIISNTVLSANKLYRIAAIRDGDSIQLMVNGKLDKSLVTQGAVLFNNGPLQVGGVSWAPKSTGSGRVVMLKWYSRAMSLRELLQFNDRTDTRGAVARFDWRGRLGLGRHVVVPPSPRFNVASDFTMTMFVTRSYDETKAWRFVTLRGEAHFYRSPAVQIFPSTGRVRVSVHLKGSVGEYVALESVSLVPLYTPTHVAVTKQGGYLALSIDGVQENAIYVGDKMFDVPSDPLQIGNLNMHVSRFNWYDHALLNSHLLEEVYTQ